MRIVIATPKYFLTASSDIGRTTDVGLDLTSNTRMITVMATKTSVVLIDDLDGETPADTTVSFGLDGKSYEIDLSDNNAAEFRDALSKYVSAGRKSGSASKGRAAVRHTTTDSIDPAAVRAWAKSQGIDVSPRGRIKSDVVEQFRAAGN
jgi:Lsr2